MTLESEAKAYADASAQEYAPELYAYGQDAYELYQAAERSGAILSQAPITADSFTFPPGTSEADKNAAVEKAKIAQAREQTTAVMGTFTAIASAINPVAGLVSGLVAALAVFGIGFYKSRYDYMSVEFNADIQQEMGFAATKLFRRYKEAGGTMDANAFAAMLWRGMAASGYPDFVIMIQVSRPEISDRRTWHSGQAMSTMENPVFQAGAVDLVVTQDWKGSPAKWQGLAYPSGGAAGQDAFNAAQRKILMRAASALVTFGGALAGKASLGASLAEGITAARSAAQKQATKRAMDSCRVRGMIFSLETRKCIAKTDNAPEQKAARAELKKKADYGASYSGKTPASVARSLLVLENDALASSGLTPREARETLQAKYGANFIERQNVGSLQDDGQPTAASPRSSLTPALALGGVAAGGALLLMLARR